MLWVHRTYHIERELNTIKQFTSKQTELVHPSQLTHTMQSAANTCHNCNIKTSQQAAFLFMIGISVTARSNHTTFCSEPSEKPPK